MNASTPLVLVCRVLGVSAVSLLLVGAAGCSSSSAVATSDAGKKDVAASSSRASTSSTSSHVSSSASSSVSSSSEKKDGGDGPHDAAPDVPISCTGVVIDAGFADGCLPTVIPLACFPAGSVTDGGAMVIAECTAVCPTSTSSEGSYCELGLAQQDGGPPDTVWCFVDSCMP